MSRVLARLTRIIGAEPARLLCERLGGMVIYIPAVPSPSSRMVLAIGHAPSARLADAMPGEKLLVPSSTALRSHRLKAAVRWDGERGLTPSEIATRHGITTRHVQRLLKEPTNARRNPAV